MIGNELSLMGDFHLTEGTSTAHGIFLISSYSLLQINEEKSVLRTSSVACEFSVTFTQNRLSFTNSLSYLRLLIDFTAVNHLPWLKERKIFSEEGRWGERRWAGRTATAKSLPQGFHNVSVTCFIPGKIAPYILSCLSLTTIL